MVLFVTVCFFFFKQKAAYEMLISDLSSDVCSSDLYDYVFTTGGIGPTHDDITVDAVAKALGVGVIVHPDARAILERYYTARGGELTEARLRMARTPDGAELIPNRMSGAPGIRIGNLFVMAGVPHITAGMLDALTGGPAGGKPLVAHTDRTTVVTGKGASSRVKPGG